jgi:hypothetical protein
MSLRKPLVACAAVMAAFAIAGPANASAATVPTARTAAGVTPLSLGCPIWYGITNPATGCEPYWAIELGFFENFWLRH